MKPLFYETFYGGKKTFSEIKAYSVIATFRLKQGIEFKLNITF